MENFLLFAGVVIIICIFMNRFAMKLPVPSLLVFIALGMCFGENGFFRISFDNYELSETICSVSLIFIMFYGGFGTNMKEARPVAVRAFLLSTAGVVLTAGFVGVFVHYCLRLPWLESILIGSVISSTDAASVFNVLRSKKLALKFHTDSLLELESGSNDPISYLLTIVMISLLLGRDISVPVILAKQLLFGVGCGLLIGKLALILLNQVNFQVMQARTIFLFSVAIIAYALPSVIGGNGFLSVYICGIFMGNSYIPQKKDMVHFFDVLTEIAQMVIFFLLGLLVTPVQLPSVFIPALLVMIFLTVVGRPAAVFLLLKPFGASMKQIGLISWAGLRGVASIVFTIYVMLEPIDLRYNLFNLVFVIVLLSLAFQGTLLPWMAEKLDMVDRSANVLKIFNDYQEETDIAFVKMHVESDHPFADQKIRDLPSFKDLLFALVLRGKQTIVPDGDTVIRDGDLLVLAAPEFEDREDLSLYEVNIGKGHKIAGLPLKQAFKEKPLLVVMIKRREGNIIPNGDTVIRDGDVLVIAQVDKLEKG